MSMRTDIIAGRIVESATNLERTWTSKGNLVIMYWHKELWYGDLDEIKKTFAEVERAAKQDYAELKDSLGRNSGLSSPRAFVHGKTKKMTVGVHLSFGKDEADENWHTILFNWAN